MRYQRAAQPLKLDGLDAARSFFEQCFAESDPARENLWVAHLDDEMCCMGLFSHEGGLSETFLPLRSIVIDAAALGSAGLLLAHNHPSGDARPSKADCLATRQLAVAANALGCRLLDHLVFSRTEHSSFRSLGLL
jgi:DNA repair protein RadC